MKLRRRRLWLWMIVVCIGVGFVGTFAGLALDSYPSWQAVANVVGNLFLSYGAGVALVLSIVQLRERSADSARDGTA